MTSIAGAMARVLMARTRTECSAIAATASTGLVYRGGVNAGIKLVQ
jgi:stage V sporulation protein SpoVS